MITKNNCEFCGEIIFYDAVEIFTGSWEDGDRGYVLDTCCEEQQNWVASDDKIHYQVMSNYAYSRSVVDGVIDFGIRTGPVSQKTAKKFVRDHHRHNKPPAGWKFGIGCYNGSDLIGVAMVGRPVARMIDHNTTLEVNRLCINHDLPYNLYCHAGSMLYGASAREGKKRGYKQIITYILEDEPGTSLKGSGWTISGFVKGRSWDTPARQRKSLPTDGINKIKYKKEFHVTNNTKARNNNSGT